MTSHSVPSALVPSPKSVLARFESMTSLFWYISPLSYAAFGSGKACTVAEISAGAASVPPKRVMLVLLLWRKAASSSSESSSSLLYSCAFIMPSSTREARPVVWSYSIGKV